MKRLDEELRAQTLAWLEEGLSQCLIASKIGCSDRTVRRISRERAMCDGARAPDKDDAREDAKERGRQRGRQPEGTPERTERFTHMSVSRKICGALVGGG